MAARQGYFNFTNSTGQKITSGEAYHWTKKYGCSKKIDLTGLPNGVTSIKQSFYTRQTTPDHWVFKLTLDDKTTYCSKHLGDRCTYHGKNGNSDTVNLTLVVIDDYNTYNINMPKSNTSRSTHAYKNAPKDRCGTNYRPCPSSTEQKYISEIEQGLASYLNLKESGLQQYCDIMPGVVDIVNGLELIVDNYIPNSAKFGVDLAFTALIDALQLPCDGNHKTDKKRGDIEK